MNLIWIHRLLQGPRTAVLVCCPHSLCEVEQILFSWSGMMYLRSLHICHLIKSKIKLSSGIFKFSNNLALLGHLQKPWDLETLDRGQWIELGEVWRASDAYNDLNTSLKNKITIIEWTNYRPWKHSHCRCSWDICGAGMDPCRGGSHRCSDVQGPGQPFC